MILRHVVPNIMPLLTFSLLGIGVAIILEGALSFLGRHRCRGERGA